MNARIGGIWKGFTAYVREAGSWVQKIPFVYVAGVGWKGRGLVNSGNPNGDGVGYAECTYWIVAEFEWTPPADQTMVTIGCIASVHQHVEISENQAVMSTGVYGWNGSSWVLLANRGHQGCSYKGETLFQTVEYTFNPFNTLYSKFKFSTGGNSFNRTITGYKKKWYGDVTIPG